jgi:hypothetical protein
MPIGRKHRRLFLFRIRWKRHHLFASVTYRQEESVAAPQAELKNWGYERGMRRVRGG